VEVSGVRVGKAVGRVLVAVIAFSLITGLRVGTAGRRVD
jgi:hypothetical protein